MSITLMRQLPAREGLALSNRYKMRRFTHDQDAHAFMAKGDNSLHWKECTQDLASGTYMSQISADRETRKPVVTYTKVER